MHRDEVRHLLRTPLTVVKGVLRLLQLERESLPEDVRAELIERANLQVLRLERAVEHVERHFSDAAEYDVIVVHEEVVQV